MPFRVQIKSIWINLRMIRKLDNTSAVGMIIEFNGLPWHAKRAWLILSLEDMTLYQFILTTDEKPTVVYPIPDEISVGYFNQDRIYYSQRHIPGSHLG